LSKSTNTDQIMESVGHELKENEPAIVGSTRRKFGPARAEKQRRAILFSKAKKLGAAVPKSPKSKSMGGY